MKNGKKHIIFRHSFIFGISPTCLNIWPILAEHSAKDSAEHSVFGLTPVAYIALNLPEVMYCWISQCLND